MQSHLLKVIADKRIEISVFFSGAVVMSYELAGSRILAPYLGTSLTVWTALIGVILASLSYGYYWGGKVADQKPDPKILGWILFVSGLFIGLTGFIKEPVLILLSSLFTNLEIAALAAALFIFAPAVFFLGFVAPYATKLKIKSLSGAGQKVGSIYAVSTAGSILGTFAGGFFLIPNLGSTRIIFLLAVIEMGLALFYFKDFKKHAVLILFLGFFIFFPLQITNSKSVLADRDTRYTRVRVIRGEDKKTQKPINLLVDDVGGTQSASFLDSQELVFDYTKFFRLDSVFVPRIKNALMIGGGAFSYPQDFLNKKPRAKIDVVEINPDYQKLAKDFFGLKESARLSIVNEDGRTFLNRNQKKYEVIYLDAFKSDSSIPFQLTTLEATRRIYNSLAKDGVVMVNLIGSMEGKGSKFIQAEISTYKRIFPKIAVYAVEAPTPQTYQNIILVGFKGKAIKSPTISEDLKGYLNKEYLHKVAPGVILTDDFAPVEKLINS